MIAYKTRKRIVWTESLGGIQAIEHQKICAIHRKDKDGNPIIYKPEKLTEMVQPGWNFSDSIMFSCGYKRFIKGRNEREIVEEFKEINVSISRQEVSRLSRLAVKSVFQIHLKNMDDVKKQIERNGGYILHIDGTVDGEYAILLVCYDSVSDVILYSIPIDTESYENVKPALQLLKDILGNPLCGMTDLGTKIRSAFEEIFPGVKCAVCRFHFLRDLGKDILENYYPALLKQVKSLGIMSKLEKLANDIEKKIDMKQISEEVQYKYTSSPSGFYGAFALTILKDITSYKEGTGYGYPFDLPILKFVTRCLYWWNYLNDKKLECEETKMILGIIKRVVESGGICELAKKVEDINKLFETLRNAMRINNDKTPLSADEPKDTPEMVHQRCNEVIATMECYLSVATMPQHIHRAIKHIIEQYRKWENYLFVPDFIVEVEGKKRTIRVPSTNNKLEAKIRIMRRLFRKHGGDKEIGKRVTDIGCDVLLFQNITNPQYLSQLFGNMDKIPYILREAKDVQTKNKKIVMRKKERENLIKSLAEMLERNQISLTPYVEELWSSVNQPNRLLAT